MFASTVANRRSPDRPSQSMIFQSNGTPNDRPFWNRIPSAPMVVSRTSRGTLRKNQVNSQATPDSTGLGDSRITANSTPPLTPTTIASAVTSRVPFRKPLMTGF
nr:hypothetical protein [Kribbella qitaiheensis]